MFFVKQPERTIKKGLNHEVVVKSQKPQGIITLVAVDQSGPPDTDSGWRQVGKVTLPSAAVSFTPPSEPSRGVTLTPSTPGLLSGSRTSTTLNVTYLCFSLGLTTKSDLMTNMLSNEKYTICQLEHHHIHRCKIRVLDPLLQAQQNQTPQHLLFPRLGW